MVARPRMIVAVRVKFLPRRGRGSNPSQERNHEAEGGGGGACLGHKFMQTAAGEAALRQATVDGGDAEGNGSGTLKTLHSWQQAAQFLRHGSAVT